MARIRAAVDVQIAQLKGRMLEPDLVEELPQAVASKPLQLGAYDRSFFAALALGKWQIGRVNWGGNKFAERWQVVMGTESKDSQKRRLLDATIGRYGNVHNSEKEWKVYLPDEFSFMLRPEQEVSHHILVDRATGRAAAYITGLLAGKLERSRSQMIFQDEKLPKDILKGFERNFHSSLGSLRRRGDGWWVLHVPRVSNLLGMLVARPSVHKLPFFKNLSKVWSEP